jgi:hypothetical protein
LASGDHEPNAVFQLSDEATRTVEDFNDNCPTVPVLNGSRPTHPWRGRTELGSACRSAGGVCVSFGADWSHQAPKLMECRVLSNEGQLPPLLPMLSPGKHRSPHSGACFMEFASLLAGERWSDHPACTHPLLAEVAQHVNDYTSDAGRPRLVTLIPSVIGLTGDDPHIDARIALGSATLALPVVSAERQRVMAVSVLACERVLASLDGRAVEALQEQSRSALAQVPDAAQWATQFTRAIRNPTTSAKHFRRHTAPAIVRDAAQGIAQALVPDPDQMLRDLLAQAIDDCAPWARRDPDRHAGFDAATWTSACRRIGAVTDTHATDQLAAQARIAR